MRALSMLLLSAALAVPTLAAAPASAGVIKEIVPEDKTAICEAAEAEFKEEYPDLEIPENTAVVLTKKYTYCPETLVVEPGTQVVWINIERTSHSVWLKEAGKEESPRFFIGDDWDMLYKVTFDDPGEYPYLCGPHYEKEGMTGKVVVKEAE